MTGPIDEAFVEIRPDLKNFDRDTKRGIDKTFDAVEDKLDDLVDTLKDEFAKLTNAIQRNFENLEDTVGNAFDDMAGEARSAGRAIDRNISLGARGAARSIDDLADDANRDLDRIERKAGSTGRGIMGMVRGVGSSISGLVSSIGSLGGQIGSAIGGASSKFGDIAGKFNAITSMIGSVAPIAFWVAVIPTVIALVNTLVQLSGALLALPAAASVAVAAFAPLMVAFQGFGEAISAVASGDAKKIEEAFKTLSPAARKVATEIGAVIKPVKQLQQAVQDAFFTQLVGKIGPAVNALLPSLRKGMTDVASAWGRVVAGFTTELSFGDNAGLIDQIFGTTTRIIDSIGPKFNNLFSTVLALIPKALPFVERFFGVIGKGVDALSGWLERIAGDGSLERWLNKAWEIGTDLWNLFKEIGGALGVLFGSTGDTGQGFIKDLTEAARKLKEFWASADGQEALARAMDIVKAFGASIIWLIETAEDIQGFFNDVVGFFTSIPGAVSSAWNSVKNFFSSIGEWFSSAWTTVTTFVANAWNSLMGFFKSLPERVGEWLSALPGRLQAAADAAFAAFFYAIGFGIGTVIAFFRDLPGRIVTIVTAMWEWIKNVWNAGVEAVVGFVRSLPGRLSAFWNSVKSTASSTWNSVKETVVNAARKLVDDTVAFAKGLPGRIKEAWNTLVSTAKGIGGDMIDGMINGIKSAAGRLVSAAKNAVSNALQGAKDALWSDSPSKKWAMLGVDSMKGYELGFGKEAKKMSQDVSNKIMLPHDAFAAKNGQNGTGGMPQVNVGGATVIAYLQVGDDQLRPVVVRTIEEEPQTVALAAEQGTAQLSRRR